MLFVCLLSVEEQTGGSTGWILHYPVNAKYIGTTAGQTALLACKRIKISHFSFILLSAETLRQAGLYFTWNNFALIYDKQAPYEAVATALREAADEKNYIIKSTHYVTAETKDTDVQAMLQQIKKFARGEVCVKMQWALLHPHSHTQLVNYFFC